MLRTSFSVRALSHTPRLLRVKWGDGIESTYPSTWLRSSVRNSQFFDKSYEYHPEHSAFVRKGLPIVAAEHIRQGPDENIQVQWEDHVTSFSVPWLRVQDAQSLKHLAKPITEKALWTNENKLPQYEFSKKEECFASWMNDLCKWGVICVHGCPPNEKGLVDFLTMIAPLWQRTYHPTNIVYIHATPKTKSVQLFYAVKILNMHTDYADYSPPPKIMGLLCTELNAPKQDVPVKTSIVDGFKVLQDLRQEDPEAFHVLSTTPIRRGRHRLDVEEECDPSKVEMYQRSFIQEEEPAVCIEGNNIKRIHMSRGKNVGLSLGAHDDAFIANYYAAYGKLEAMLTYPKYTQDFVLQPGMMLVIDNYRLCHARSEIPPSTHRVAMSAYISEDGWCNRWRLMLGKRSGLDAKWLFGCSDEALKLLAQRSEDSYS